MVIFFIFVAIITFALFALFAFIAEKIKNKEIKKKLEGIAGVFFIFTILSCVGIYWTWGSHTPPLNEINDVAAAEQKQTEVNDTNKPNIVDTKRQVVEQKTETIQIPIVQDDFINIVLSAYNNYNTASNELAQGGARRKRANAICGILKSTNIANWVGTIDNLSTNSDGLGVLSIKIANDIKLKTWNNALSDIGDNTLIDPDSQLFQNLSTFKEGQIVKFSGSFFRDTNKVDCFRENSMTLNGSMSSPEYVFKFKSVMPYNNDEQKDATSTIIQKAPETKRKSWAKKLFDSH